MKLVPFRSHQHSWRQYRRDADDTRPDKHTIAFDGLYRSQKADAGDRHHQAAHLPLLAERESDKPVETLDFSNIVGEDGLDCIDFHKVFGLEQARHRTPPIPGWKRKAYHDFFATQVKSSSVQSAVSPW